MASWCSSGARTEPAFIWESGVAPSMSSGLPSAVPSTAASLPRWALSSAAVLITKRRVGSSPGVSERTRRYGAVERDAVRFLAVSAPLHCPAQERGAVARRSAVRSRGRGGPPRCYRSPRLADFQESGLTPAEVGACPTPGTATSSPRSRAGTIRRAWASERTSLSVPQTISVGQETRPSVGPQSRPAARVALLWSGGRRGVGASG